MYDAYGLSHLTSPPVHTHLYNIQYDTTCEAWRKREKREGGRGMRE